MSPRSTTRRVTTKLMAHRWQLPSVVGLNPSALNTEVQDGAPKRPRAESPSSMEDDTTSRSFSAILYNAIKGQNGRPKLVYADSTTISRSERSTTDMTHFSDRFNARQMAIAEAIDNAFIHLETDIMIGTVSPFNLILKMVEETQRLPPVTDKSSLTTCLLIHSIINGENENMLYSSDEKENIVEKVDNALNPDLQKLGRRSYEEFVARQDVDDLKTHLDNLYVSLTNANVKEKVDDSSSLVVDIKEVRYIIDTIRYTVGVPEPQPQDRRLWGGAQSFDRY